MFEPINVVRIIAEKITAPTSDGSLGSALYTIPIELSSRPSADWIKVFIQKWDHPKEWTSSHQRGIASVSGNVISLERTTIERVEQTHKKTLLLAVAEANEIIEKHEQEQKQQAEQQKQRLEAETAAIREAASKVKF